MVTVYVDGLGCSSNFGLSEFGLRVGSLRFPIRSLQNRLLQIILKLLAIVAIEFPQHLKFLFGESSAA
jgi:hypothetical protein